MKTTLTLGTCQLVGGFRGGGRCFSPTPLFEHHVNKGNGIV